MKRIGIFTLLLALIACTAWAGETVDGKAAFEKLKTLAGNWDGKAGETFR